MRGGLTDKVGALGVGLVAAYLEVCATESKTAAARRIGVDLARLGQYRRGERPVPDDKQRVMRRVLLGHLFPQETAEALASVLEV
jgi:hypothetical protein